MCYFFSFTFLLVGENIPFKKFLSLKPIARFLVALNDFFSPVVLACIINELWLAFACWNFFLAYNQIRVHLEF